MAVTRTFSIIKPDATRRNLTGAITKMLEEAGLRVAPRRASACPRAGRMDFTRSTRTAVSTTT